MKEQFIRRKLDWIVWESRLVLAAQGCTKNIQDNLDYKANEKKSTTGSVVFSMEYNNNLPYTRSFPFKF